MIDADERNLVVERGYAFVDLGQQVYCPLCLTRYDSGHYVGLWSRVQEERRWSTNSIS